MTLRWLKMNKMSVREFFIKWTEELMDDRQKNARGMIRELLGVETGLSSWEISFIENICEWDGNLTEKQIATIEKIYERVL